MNLLWMCNIELPIISKNLGNEIVNSGGWMDIFSRKLAEDGHKIHVIYPLTSIRSMKTIKTNNLTIYQIPHSRKHNSHYDKSYEKTFYSILKENSFDSIHLWGCEFPRTLAMIKSCEQANILDRTVLDIQGLRHFIAKNFYASLPLRVVLRNRVHDIYHRSSIRMAKRTHEKAGKYELESIRKIRNVLGRTDWDLACVKSINPQVNYFKCNRILRKSFYQHKWQRNGCTEYSLLASSYATPAKGLHYVLEALPIILQEFPQTHLYIVGYYESPNSLWGKLKINGYGKYIHELIKKYSLENNVTFLGRLNEAQMCKRFLESHAYVSASTMENSPNTVAESMALGCPVVSSLVGGVSSFISHGEEGFLYQYDAPYMMAHYIKEIFESDTLADSMSEKARKRAKATYDISANYANLLHVYQTLATNEEDAQ